MATYKVLDIYKDLPRTNCGECGKGSCFAFASSVYLEGTPLRDCPELENDRLAAMEAKLQTARGQGEGTRPPANQQALEFLLGRLADADLAVLAKNAAAKYLPGPPEQIEVDFLGVRHVVRRGEVEAPEGEPPSIWVKIFLLIYLTRAVGAAPAGEWVAFRELPNTASKARTFEECAARIARAFEGNIGALDRAAAALGGRRPSDGLCAGDRAYVIRALPRVDLLLLFWDRQEDFPARVCILVDRGLLDYLDQEAAVFLVEAFAGRLLGTAVPEVSA